ncbi:MAG: patatin-like phospholipase family protein [Cyanobacteria bacterium J06634_5]
MPRLTRDQHLFGAGPKRILALDGGGIRGMFSLQILHKIEAIVRQRMGDDTACLADYFDLIGGTSTGSVIASGLALGWSVSKLDELYRDLGDVIFQQDLLRHGVVRAKFSAKPLRQVLKREFGDITLGDDAIRTGLAIMTKRLDTGSPWIVFNNPEGLFFNEIPDSDDIPNRDYLLRQIIRASTAAPHFFEPERVAISEDVEGAFVDGGVSPHNNPAMQLFLLATLDGYKLNWPMGPDNLLVVSVGTGFKALRLSTEKVMKMKSAELALQSLQSLMDDASHYNELLLQMFSQSPTAREIDMEVGTAANSNLQPWLTYLRYDAALEREWIKEKLGITAVEEQVQELLAMDNPDKIETFARLGKRTAERLVEADHFPSSFDIEPVTP